MATDAYNLWIGEQNIEMASVFCILLIIPSVFVYVVQNYLLKEGSFVTVSGQMVGTEKRRITWYIQYRSTEFTQIFQGNIWYLLPVSMIHDS